MRNRLTQVLLLITLALSSNALAQKGELKVSDCRVGTVTVVTRDGGVRVRTHGRMLDLFGRTVNADDLVKIVSERLTAATDEKYECDDERFRGAVFLLASAKDTRVLGPLLEMSNSSCPHSCSAVVSSMAKLVDRRALPRMLEILRSPGECSYAVVLAIAKLGDETAIKHLIDSIPPGGGNDAEARYKAIEEITGLSLDPIRNKWGTLFYDNNLRQFHRAMHEWWAANKHRAKIKKTP